MTEYNKEVHNKGSSLKKKVGLTAAAVGTAAVGFFGAGQGIRSVDAATPTPTPRVAPEKTPTPTPTPTSKEAEIARLEKALEEARRNNAQDKKIAELRAALQRLTTPTSTPVPPTATPDKQAAQAVREVRQDKAYGEERARLREEYDRTHPSPPASPKPEVKKDDGGIPIVPLAAAAVAGAVGWANRRRIVDVVRNPATRAGALDLGRRAWNFTRTQGGRAITAIRTRLHI